MKQKLKRKSNLDWYYKNRDYQMQKQREWLAKNKQQQKQYRKEYRKKNRDKVLRWKNNYRSKYPNKNKEYLKKWYERKREELLPIKRQESIIYYKKNRDKILAYSKLYRKTHKEYEKKRHAKYQKENPRSNRSLPLDLQFAMNQVRKRDGNKCMWQGCNLTFKEAPIHVHHIFPISEYPELQYEQRYMICYCANHHGLFHRYRGDPYSEWITRKENDLEVSKF